MRRLRPVVGVVFLSVSTAMLRAAPTLSVPNATFQAAQPGTIIVEGYIQGESTFGVTVMVELIPRPGVHGQLRFTPSPPVDVMQLGDAWPSAGSFSRFDTDVTESPSLNGFVDDNGTFISTPTTFSGPLVALPIESSGNASGTWDAVLSTSIGISGWEGLPTTLVTGVITVEGVQGIPTLGDFGLAVLAVLVLAAGGAMVHRTRHMAPAFQSASRGRG